MTGQGTRQPTIQESPGCPIDAVPSAVAEARAEGGERLSPDAHQDKPIAECGSDPVETRFRRKDGTAITVLLSASPLNASDLSRGVTIAVLDITERKRFEVTLRESEARFRTIFEHTAVGIALTAPDGRFMRVNRRFCDIVGRAEKDLLRCTFQD